VCVCMCICMCMYVCLYIYVCVCADLGARVGLIDGCVLRPDPLRGVRFREKGLGFRV